VPFEDRALEDRALEGRALEAALQKGSAHQNQRQCMPPGGQRQGELYERTLQLEG